MKDYTELQKQIVMLTSDLLPKHLTEEEIKKFKRYTQPKGKLLTSRGLKMLKVSDELKEKLKEILSMKMQFGMKLTEINQKGIEIVFSNEQEFTKELRKYCGNQSYVFTLGKAEIISNGVCYFQTQEALQSDSAILIMQQPLNYYLNQKQVVEKIQSNKLILVSKNYHVQPSDILPPRKQVFLSGSRSFVALTDEVYESLRKIMQQGLGIVLGDASQGVDAVVAQFLRQMQYPHVTVYTLSARAGFKLDNKWQVQRVKVAQANITAQERHMQKDRQMGEVADWGLAIFDPISLNRYGNLQVSAGTLRNTIQLLLRHKPVKFFYTFEQKLSVTNLKQLSDLEEVLARFAQENLSTEEESAIYQAKSVSHTQPANQIKAERLMKKYRELLRKERIILNLTPEMTMSTVKEDSQDSKPNKRDDFEQLKLF